MKTVTVARISLFVVATLFCGLLCLANALEAESAAIPPNESFAARTYQRRTAERFFERAASTPKGATGIPSTSPKSGESNKHHHQTGLA